MKSPVFSQGFEDILIPSTDLCIDAFLNNNEQDLSRGFKSISTFQYQNMQGNDSKLFQQLWRDGASLMTFH